MKRDMDLIRDILLAVEAQPPGLFHQIGVQTAHDQPTVLGHLRLVSEAGLLDGEMRFISDTVLIAIHGLSNKGHDFLEAIRNETVWAQTKEKIRSVGGGMAIDSIKVVATFYLNKLLGLGG